MKRDYLLFLLFTLIVLVTPLAFKGGYLLNVLVFMGINTMLAVALNLLLGFAGQISLGHAAFFGLGAYISGILTATHGINSWLSMLIAAVMVGILAFGLGFPILKLKGHYLAMATLGFGIIIYIVLNETVDLTGGPSGLSGIPKSKLGALVFDGDLKNYYLIWSFTLVTMLLSINLANSRIGRALRAIHDSEVASRVMGVNARLLKVQVFTLSAIISAVAGSLYAHTMSFISPASFGFNFSVELVTMVIIGGLGSIFGSFLGAALLTMLPEMLRVVQDYDIVVYGLLLIVMTMFMPKGLAGGIAALARSVRSKKNRTAEMLRVDGITQIFGGLTALEDVSFMVEKGTITGVIGPNGAGKTTLFNIITGLYTQTSGKIFLEGTDISGYVPERLAPLGLVRTFQNIEMFNQMTVLENVLVGLHTGSRSGMISCALKLPWHLAEERRMREEALTWLDFCGIADLAEIEAGALAFGKCRIVEVARAMAVKPRLLLMDEPAAGLNNRETDDLEVLIRKIRDTGVTVVLVEHDMELVMDICDAIVVLNLGQKLAQGTPREIQENPDVIKAYLGEG